MRKMTRNGIEQARKLQEALQIVREARMQLEAKNDINGSAYRTSSTTGTRCDSITMLLRRLRTRLSSFRAR